jgi:hypothetical protein
VANCNVLLTLTLCFPLFCALITIANEQLTKSVLSQQVLRRRGRLAWAGLVHGLHAELIRLALDQIGHASFSLIAGNLRDIFT